VIELPSNDAPGTRILHGELRLRYEDVSQDRRAKIGVLPASLGVVWRAMIRDGSEDLKKLRAEGIVPVLRRIVIVATDTPIAIQHPLAAQGYAETAHCVGDRTRFMLNMRTDLSAPRASTYPPPPENPGAVAPVGGVFAEHIYSRIFAPKEKRRIDRLPDGVNPGPIRPWVELDSLFRTHAEEVDPELLERGHVRFGLTHTDSNQHVNSLVYPQIFEERALEAWARADLLARSLHLIWRKPCFAGDVGRVRVQRIQNGEQRGAIAGLWVGDESQPRCAAQLWL